MTKETEQSNVSEHDAAAQKTIEDLQAKIKKLTEATNQSRTEAEAAKAAAEEAEEAKARAANDLQALEASLTKKHQKQIDELTAKLTESEGNLRTQLIDNAIKSKMVEHNISPALQTAFEAMVKQNAKLDGMEAMIGDKPLAQYMTEFVASEQGKAFVLAPTNSGGGATGGSGQVKSGSISDMLREAGAQI